MNSNISHLLENPAIWRIGDLSKRAQAGWATGFAALDRELPDCGWPKQGMSEILCNDMGVGEVSLLAPALAAMTREGKGVVWVNPPHLPYAPALVAHDIDLAKVLIVRTASHADSLWAAEQALRSGAVNAVLLWLRQHVDYQALRRLHLACETGASAAFVYRASCFGTQSSPAPLRIAVSAQQGKLSLCIIKRRGLMSSRDIAIDTAANRWPEYAAALKAAAVLSFPRTPARASIAAARDMLHDA
jgi:protein ImuA